ncbi:hypothetical protein EJV47_20440 [Hymenobacter gummosus]|uniref:Uncharacterized protein n=1 Tax=Hymenobacter gummosus TaxID=1776032 RepID=A0A3S0J7B3_9BACT|nr:hypothetical protein [Hymenobacter gummosus]RTQ46746.1 hypothetical protein EJV47_20440 [Hymenobacter gummosus]
MLLIVLVTLPELAAAGIGPWGTEGPNGLGPAPRTKPPLWPFRQTQYLQLVPGIIAKHHTWRTFSRRTFRSPGCAGPPTTSTEWGWFKRHGPYKLYNAAGQRLTPYEYQYVINDGRERLQVTRRLPDRTIITEWVSPDGTVSLSRR